MLEIPLFFDHHTGQKIFSHQVGITQLGTTKKVYWLVKGGENIGKTDGVELPLDANCTNCGHIFPRRFNFHHQMCLRILNDDSYTFINWQGPNICPNYKEAK